MTRNTRWDALFSALGGRAGRAAGLACLAALVAAGLVWPNEHPHFGLDAWPGFFAVFALAGTWLLARLAGLAGRLRADDDPDGGDAPTPDDACAARRGHAAGHDHAADHGHAGAGHGPGGRS